jgi:hypothetical protein
VTLNHPTIQLALKGVQELVQIKVKLDYPTHQLIKRLPKVIPVLRLALLLFHPGMVLELREIYVWNLVDQKYYS